MYLTLGPQCARVGPLKHFDGDTLWLSVAEMLARHDGIFLKVCPYAMSASATVPAFCKYLCTLPTPAPGFAYDVPMYPFCQRPHIVNQNRTTHMNAVLRSVGMLSRLSNEGPRRSIGDCRRFIHSAERTWSPAWMLIAVEDHMFNEHF